ncbi:hypothetical protein METBIDRAFT_48091 [Metschnikowia bicuspidata var. bicuspidata NRRL YB-4993]|uniref:DNA replication regulator SLD2 n=1 Tax=Metschnikowia bicuspidata var. bicuspidata NRRL YB-4993 TaxID=869754 RepID=A0A1A0GYY2_9ASCO|nr:hypothetical protein METBIDRAFT_48091 [Metschnikowia bicuspidata var. bicuspidata NRRL YB-4993]OBA16961.1 hypothetical protein METBIDRAFT_48091 [Metschnikowia bicuspidata var. bicuspidata NRRL YB-4993]
MSGLLEHKLRIKEWERGFAAKHGRVPSKADVKADVEIWKAYKAYNEMKKASRPAKREPDHPSKNPEGQRLKEQDSGSQNTENGFERVMPVQNAELGPTPQANGKVLSIFDLILSPPESSLVKQVQGKPGLFLPLSSLGPTSPFKTPTKSARPIHFGDVTPSRGPSVAEKLRMVSSPAKLAQTPTLLARHDVIETPRYLGKVNSKFSFASQHSPFQASPSKQHIFQTPTKPTPIENFQVSPSPLKSQRLLLSRLSDIYNAHQKLAMDEEYAAQRKEFEKEFEVDQPEPQGQAPSSENIKDMRKRKKATTQKRTTRRWKIKPRTEDGQNEAFDGKDVHEEIKKLETQERLELAQYIDGEVSAEEASDEEEEVVVRKKPASTKINPVSNNFQRLKINDPRAKKFKQRMRRR